MRYLEAAVNLSPDRRPTKQQAAVYFDLLGDLPPDTLMAAAKRAAIEHRFATLPPVGLIRQHARDLANPPVSAADAYEAVMLFVRSFGSWMIETPTWEPNLKTLRVALGRLPARARRAAEAYGWQTLCDSPQSITKPQFCQIYDGMDGAAQVEAMMPEGLRLNPSVAGIVGQIGRPFAGEIAAP